MSKTEIILLITSLVGLGMTFYLYKQQNKNSKVIRYIELDNKELE